MHLFLKCNTINKSCQFGTVIQTRKMVKKMNRRNFIETGGKIALATGVLALPGQAANHKSISEKFVHHVFFWLKEPVNKQHNARFQKALHELVTIDSIQHYQLGKPADTRREVIDSTFQYSLLTIFADKAAHDNYQVHTVHDSFRQVAGDLCSKVVVYDSVNF